MSMSQLTSGIRLAAVLACAGGAASWPPGNFSRHHTVEIRNLMFKPQGLHVASGDTISWVNQDIVPHTVTAGDGEWDSGEMPPGETFTWVAKGSGSNRYICRYHPTMSGNLLMQ